MTSTIVGSVTLIVAFNLEIFIGIFYRQRAILVRDMRNDDSWKELGTKLQESNPNRRTPSDWWLIVYLIHRLIKKVMWKKWRKGSINSTPDGGEP
jgi:hypothetical protein